MLNKKNILVATTLILVLLIALYMVVTFRCRLTDADTMNITKTFCKKVGINDIKNLSVSSISISQLIVFGPQTKIIQNGNDIIVTVDCISNEVVHLTNNKLLSASKAKYVDANNRQKWPQFLEENEAKEILLTITNRIGLPVDVELSSVNLDEKNGIWTAQWKRKYNGIAYDKDYMAVSILAVNGEFYSFSKYFHGEPCVTDARVDKNAAIEAATREFANFFSKDKWVKNKDKFVVKSAELRIVQPNVWKHFLSFCETKSKLAWVVTFDIKEGSEKDTIGIMNEGESIIKIDALNNQLIDKDIHVVP